MCIRDRYRVNGRLVEISPPGLKNIKKLLSRFRVLASLDLNEHVSPQDGSFSREHEGTSRRFRISIIPGRITNSISIRIISGDKFSIATEEPFLHHHLSDTKLRLLKDTLLLESGAVLFTGSTGSGKSTMLYSCLLYTSPSPRDATLSRMPSSA